jgi:hypothetical protein
MPNVHAEIEYLQDLDLYKTEKPYWCLLPPHEGFDPDKQRVDNLEFEPHSNILITDIRPFHENVTLEEYGFQVLPHSSNYPDFTEAASVNAYMKETEALLRDTFEASYVKTYDCVLRKNIIFERTEFDLADLLHTEGPARGAHNDITHNSGPEVIQRYMDRESISRFLKPGYRCRIINTWRSLLPVAEDRPLALCNSRSVNPSDLVESDRVIPNKSGEVYYLKYNPQHEWYWLSEQSPSEPFVFVMYDTKDGEHSRFCPHVSFNNPVAPIDAPPRRSVETRSIVITRDSA